VLWVPRAQLKRGLNRTMTMADLSADGQGTLPQVSSTVGQKVRWKLKPKSPQTKEPPVNQGRRKCVSA